MQTRISSSISCAKSRGPGDRARQLLEASGALYTGATSKHMWRYPHLNLLTTALCVLAASPWLLMLLLLCVTHVKQGKLGTREPGIMKKDHESNSKRTCSEKHVQGISPRLSRGSLHQHACVQDNLPAVVTLQSAASLSKQSRTSLSLVLPCIGVPCHV